MLLKLPVMILALLQDQASYAQNFALAIEIMLSGNVKFNRFKL